MKLYLKSIANPYTVFSISWLLCLFLYSLGWAGIYPKLSSELSLFVISLIVVMGLTAIFYKRIKINLTPISVNTYRYKVLFAFNLLLWALNFLYSGIPIFNGLRDLDFGIPFVKIISASLNNFLSIYFFYLFLISGKKKFLLYCGLCFFLFALVISRGNIMLSMVSMFFMWINIKNPILSVTKGITILAFTLTILFLFGVAGNYRTIKNVADNDSSVQDNYSSKLILGIGEASTFYRNYIPGEFFWGYLYISSPLSNLQYNLNKPSKSSTPDNISMLIINEILFDAISNKIDEGYHLNKQTPALLVDTLTVSTAFAGSYVYAGWTGVLIYVVIFWLLPFIYTILLAKNPLAIIGVSVLCTVYFFSIFDNMLILTALTSQLLYPIFMRLSINK